MQYVHFRGGSRNLKGGGFIVVVSCHHARPHPVFLAKGGGVLLNFENDRRTPLDPPVHLVGGTIIITKIRVHGSVFRLPGGMALAPWPLWQSNGTKNTYFQESSRESRSSPGNSTSQCSGTSSTRADYACAMNMLFVYKPRLDCCFDPWRSSCQVTE